MFLSIMGLGLDMAFRMSREDNVKFYIHEKDSKDIGDGIVDKVASWEPYVKWADVIVIDDCDFGKVGDDLRRRGKKVFGGSVWGDRLENDRVFGMDMAERCGLSVPWYQEFNSLQNAISFIEKDPQPWVLKPCGSQEDRTLCYVGKEKDGSDVINFLKNFKPSGKPDFILQEKIEGTEVGVSGYFDGTRFSKMKNINFEHKKMLDGDLGPNTGETGTLLFHRDNEPIFRYTVDRIAGMLKKNNYRGWIDIESIADSEGVWFLEFTARWGYPQMFIVDPVMQDSWGKVISDVASGTLENWPVSEEFSTGVLVFGEGYPYYEAYPKRGKGREIKGITEDNIDNVHFGEVKVEKDRLICTGGEGWNLVVTGKDNIIEKSIKQCYDNIRGIDIPSMGYRTDIGAKCPEKIEKLTQMGYLGAQQGLIDNFIPWIGFDLDKTLAMHQEGQAGIGKPIPDRVARLKRYVDAGTKVKIFTARAAIPSDIPVVKEWMRKNGLPALEVTNEKDPGLIKIIDDKAEYVTPNAKAA